MLDYLNDIDTKLFLAINNGCQNSFFDVICPILRNAKNWIPLYLVAVFFTYKLYPKKWWLIILGAAFLILITDQFSANLVKNTFERLRPCNNPALKPMVRTLVNCGGGYSFMSAHATNHFAIAIYFSMVFKKWVNNILPWSLIWAFSIAISQVYVGVHYPFDVLAGAITGCIFGYLIYILLKLKFEIG